MRPETTHRYGTQGQTQRGIDLTVQHEDGKVWAFSNKRYRRYQPHHVREHIEETTYEAEQYVMLISVVASTEVRDEIKKFPKWELWDSEDLSQKIRLELQNEMARRIVDHHFGPYWRREFLGLPAVGAFLSPADYFRPFLDGGRLFHHNFPLVGRQDLLDILMGFGEWGSERVLVLPGRGGIGKSRLLREWANRLDSAHPSRAVRLLSEGVPLSLESLDDLPAVSCVVAVDDAHRRTDLGPLFAWLRQRADSKLLLSTRLQGVDYLLSELTRAGFDASQVRRLQALEPLSKEEVAQLSAQVLGVGRDNLVDLLTQATRDCPLVTVVGGRLLATRSVHPELLERNADFRQEVLNRFRDESLGRVSELVPPVLARQLLELIAALSPVPVDAGPLHDGIAAYLTADPVEVTRALGELERVGLLLRRVHSFRVVPDVLADHVLAGACLTQGRATGFADKVFASFAKDCLAQLLRNLAELDWRVKVDSGDDSPLLDSVWGQISEVFKAGGHQVRTDLLRQLRDSAYFVPGRVLELVSFAVHKPFPGGPEEVVSGFLSFTHDNVVRTAPELLQRCAYSPDCISTCLDLLWELDRYDDRCTNSNTDHPFRILTELAEWRPHKPVWVNRAVVAAVRRWLTQSDAWGRRHTPLDLLSRLLEKSGIEQDADNLSVRLSPFHLDYESVRELRDEVLDILDACVLAGGLGVILKVIQVLGTGLQGPMPFLNMVLSPEELRQWEPEQLRILEMLGRMIEKDPHPVVSLSILGVVRQQARFGHHEAVRDCATTLVRSLDQSFDFRLTRLLLPDMSRWDLFEEDAGPDPVANRDERYRSLARTAAMQFLERFPEPALALLEIDRRLQEMLTLKQKADAADLFWWLFETNPEIVTPFAQQMLTMPDSPIGPSLKIALVHLQRKGLGVALDLACDAVHTEAFVFRHAVAHFLAWNVHADTPLHDQEIELVRRLIADPDARVRSMAVAALRRTAVFRPRVALDLARTVDSREAVGVTIELCRLADPDWHGCGDAFKEEDIIAILEKVEEVEDLGHEIARFLKFACERVPQAVLEMLIRRIERQERDGYQSSCRPIPFHALHDTFASLSNKGQHRDLLRSVRDYALDKTGLVLHSLVELYRDVSLGYGNDGVAMLEDWLLNGDQGQMETGAALLEAAPNRFVFDQLELVGRVLDRAETFGEECHRMVSRVFYKIATSGMRRGTPGQPFPEDLALRDRSRLALQNVASGSSVYRLLIGVLSRSEQDIKRTTEERFDSE
jgi:hypothetical protein